MGKFELVLHGTCCACYLALACSSWTVLALADYLYALAYLLVACAGSSEPQMTCRYRVGALSGQRSVSLRNR